MRAVHGVHMKGQSQRFYACDQCGSHLRAEKGKRKPTKCPSCGEGSLFYMASRSELYRLRELLLLQRGGHIKDLKIQPRFDLHAPRAVELIEHPGIARPGSYIPFPVGQYVADFSYQERIRDKWYLVVEDVKGRVDTHLSAWKRRHAEQQYAFRVRLISWKQRR